MTATLFTKNESPDLLAKTPFFRYNRLLHANDDCNTVYNKLIFQTYWPRHRFFLTKASLPAKKHQLMSAMTAPTLRSTNGAAYAKQPRPCVERTEPSVERTATHEHAVYAYNNCTTSGKGTETERANKERRNTQPKHMTVTTILSPPINNKLMEAHLLGTAHNDF